MIRSLVKSSTYSSLTSVAAYGLTIILARDESQLAFAQFTYSVAWALIFTQIIDLAATQCLSHFQITSKENSDAILSNIFGSKVAMLCVILLLVVTLSFVEGVEIPLTTIFFLVPAFYLGPFFELRSQNVLFARMLFAEKTILLLFCSIYLRYNPIDLVVYAAYFIASATSLFLQFQALGLRAPRLWSFDVSLITRYVGLYWPIYLTLASQVAYGHISRVIIEAKLGIIAFAAVSLALQIVNALKIVQTQVDRHLRPRVAKLVQSTDGHAARKLTVHYFVLYLLPLAVGCSLLYLLADEIIRLLFGSKWAIAAVYLRYLSPLLITIAILRYLDIFVVALGIGRANLGINLLAAGVLIFSLAIIPTGQDARIYLLTIVGVQIMHILTLIAFFLIRYGRRRNVPAA